MDAPLCIIFPVARFTKDNDSTKITGVVDSKLE